ncbi:unnamed protein product, partial [Heterotrigona itama]
PRKYRQVLVIEANQKQNPRPRISRVSLRQITRRSSKGSSSREESREIHGSRRKIPRDLTSSGSLRDKRGLERSMESGGIAGNPRNCQRSTEFREIPRIRRSFDRIP